MLSEEQQIFDQAFSHLKKKDVNGFIEKLYMLYNILTCNCFFRSQKEDLYSVMLKLIIKYPDDENDYILNVAKGFIYLRNHNEEIAFKYLSIAIIINKSNYLAFSLISEIDIKINLNCVKHAKSAVQLCPTARNYYLLAKSYGYENSEGNGKNIDYSIKYFKKALKLNSNFSCAHAYLGIRYIDARKHEFAIKEFKAYLELDPNDVHGAFGLLCMCLIVIKDYKGGLELTLERLSIDKEAKTEFYRAASFCYLMGNYKEAINYYNDYLTFYPDNKAAINGIEKVNKKIEEKLYDAKIFFRHGEYNQAVSSYREYLKNATRFSLDDITGYGISLIKINNPLVQIDESNSIFIKMDNLMQSYRIKVKNGQPTTKDEVNIHNLTVYQANQKIGFGKYKGQILLDIMNKDPHYFLWCIINLLHFSVYSFLLYRASIEREPEFLTALEHNLIKELIYDKYFDNFDNSDLPDNPRAYNNSEDYDTYNEAFEGDQDAWDHYNQ